MAKQEKIIEMIELQIERLRAKLEERKMTHEDFTEESMLINGIESLLRLL
jgi:hypothetical protein